MRNEAKNDIEEAAAKRDYGYSIKAEVVAPMIIIKHRAHRVYKRADAISSLSILRELCV